MNSALQDKINKLKQQEKEDLERKRQDSIKAEIANQKYWKSKVSEAKIWVENNLLDLIAKEDIKIEKFNKSRLGYSHDKYLLKELLLSHSIIPKEIPIESVVEAIKAVEDLYTDARLSQGFYLDDDHTCFNPPSYNYYVKW